MAHASAVEEKEQRVGTKQAMIMKHEIHTYIYTYILTYEL
jgi:hypothetical protein